MIALAAAVPVSTEGLLAGAGMALCLAALTVGLEAVLNIFRRMTGL